MGKVITIIVAIVLIIVAANVGKFLIENAPDPEEPNVVDGLTGKMAVDRFLEIKKKQDEFNLPALRKAFSMYYIEHGQYPKNLEVLQQAGYISADITHDYNGIPFQLNIQQEQAVLLGAGEDQIHGTTDDVFYQLTGQG